MPNMSDSRRKAIQAKQRKAENAKKRAAKIAKRERNGRTGTRYAPNNPYADAAARARPGKPGTRLRAPGFASVGGF
jgi:hypothetical protein